MDFDFLNEIDEAAAAEQLELRLQQDEQPTDFSGSDDCGDACKI